MAKKKNAVQFRARLSGKTMELGNLIAITLAIGQFVSGQEFSSFVFFSGIIVLLCCYIISYIVSP